MKLLILLIGLCSLLLRTTVWGQIQLGADILGNTDGTGRVMAISGDGKRVVVGARNDNSGGTHAGSARIYAYQGNAWVQVGSDIDGNAAGLNFGEAVDLSYDGKRVVVLAPGYINNGYPAGQVKVYQETNGVWSQVGNTIVGQSTSQFGDLLHYDVAMSDDGKRIVVGTKNNRVKVFEENNGFWIQMGTNITGGGHFGISVDISADGKRLVVGAPYDNASGHARVFQENGGTWTQLGATINGPGPYSHSGYSVAISGDGKRVIVGAPYYNHFFDGQAVIYGESGGIWTQIGAGIIGEAADDNAGWDVDINSDGTRVIISAIDNTDGGSGAGHARIFKENSGTWTQVGNDIDGQGPFNIAGHAVSISNDGYTAGLGAPGYRNGTVRLGNVRVFGLPISPACIEQRTIHRHYCQPRVTLLERTGIVHTSEITLGINSQGVLPKGAPCTSPQATWTHFNIKTESFSPTGPMNSPILQATLNNIPISDLYSVPGSNLQFYNLPATAIASTLFYNHNNTVYRLRVTITGVNGTVTSSHSSQYVLRVSPDQPYLCTTPSTGGGLSH